MFLRSSAERARERAAYIEALIATRRAEDRDPFGSEINRAAEELFAAVKGEDLAGGEGALGRGETDERGAAAFGNELERHARIAVAHAAFDGGGCGERLADPAHVVHADFAAEEAGRFGMVERDEQRVVRGAFADNDVVLVVGIGRDADVSPLAERVVMQAAVAAEFASVGGADDRAGLVGHEGAEEILHLHFADEADALAVFFFGGGEARFACEAAEFGFGQVPDGETGVAELLLVEQREEVGLVFVFVGAFEENAFAGGSDRAARVVSGGDGGEAVIARPRAEHAELDLAVAHHVGIRREAAGVAVEEVVDDFCAIIAHQIYDVKLEADLLGDSARIDDVLLPRAVADDVFLVDPVLHVSADDVVALLLEQQGGDGAVDATGHGDEDFFARGHGVSDEGRAAFVKSARTATSAHRGACGITEPAHSGAVHRVNSVVSNQEKVVRRGGGVRGLFRRADVEPRACGDTRPHQCGGARGEPRGCEEAC